MIRDAARADAEQLAGLQLRAWHRAYTEFVDPERFGTLNERVARWHEQLTAGPGRSTLVHDLGGRLSGFASVGAARDGDAAGLGELRALYVDPPAQGAGVGGALLTAAEDRLRADGRSEALLWVFEANEHARHVYERRGWILDRSEDTRHLAAVDWWAPAVRYRRRLA